MMAFQIFDRVGMVARTGLAVIIVVVLSLLNFKFFNQISNIKKKLK